MLNRSIFVEDTRTKFQNLMRDQRYVKHLDIASAYNQAGAICVSATDNYEHLTQDEQQHLAQAKMLWTMAGTILTDLQDALTAIVESITGTEPTPFNAIPEPPATLSGALLGQSVYLATPKGDGMSGQVVTLSVDPPGVDPDDLTDDDDQELVQYIVLKVPVTLDVTA